MQKHFLVWVGALALAGISQASCSEQDPVKGALVQPTVAVTSTASTDSISWGRLLTTMAADPLAREYLRASADYGIKYDAWWGLTQAGRREARLKLDSAAWEAFMREDKPFNPAHAAAVKQLEVATTYQAKVVKLFAAKYPQIKELDLEDFKAFNDGLIRRLATIPRKRHAATGGTGLR